MKEKEFAKFARKYLLSDLPGFEVKGRLIFQVPVMEIFRGFIFDSSGFSAEAFHPEAFVQPLYVPSPHITMTLGDRLPGVWTFQADDESLANRLLRSMKTEGMRLLKGLDSPQKLARNAEKVKSPRNHYVRQAGAYSLIWIGNYKKAMRKVEELLAMLRKASHSQSWALDVHSEVVRLRETLASDPEKARALLRHWTEQTRHALDLPK